VILATRGGQDRELRAANFRLPGRTTAYGSAVYVSPDTAQGIPAFDAVIAQASQAVACLALRVWRGVKVNRQEVTSTWQARLFASPPNPRQTWFEFWETAEASMTARRNAFVWRTLENGRPVALWALHPDQVYVLASSTRGATYKVAVGGGWLDPTGQDKARQVEVDEGTILHVKGPGGGGRLTAPSPIEIHRHALGAAIAQQQYQEGFYAKGTQVGLAVLLPREMNQTQAQTWREMWQATYGGPENAGKTAVLGGGASIEKIGMSQQDAQYVESAQMTIDDVARILNWPASLIGGAKGVGAGGGPISPEHELTRMVRYALAPRLARWEAALAADPYLFGPGSRDYPGFDREGLIRADVATQTDADVKNVQSGILLVDEVRAERGLPPLPDNLGQIPQIIPVGGSPAGVPTAGQPAAVPDDTDSPEE